MRRNSRSRTHERYGAEVVLYDRLKEDRVAIGKKLAAERGLVLVPPFDDFHVMAGQGTIGLELVEDAKAMGGTLDAVLVPCSGGGLSAGIATALAALSPATKLYAVEPAELRRPRALAQSRARSANSRRAPRSATR